MNKILRNIFGLVLISFLFVGSVVGQEIGKIFTNEEADNLFGEVLIEKEIDLTELNNLLNNTNNVIMFKLDAEGFTVLGDDRKLLLSTANYVEKNEIFHMFSKSKVQELVKNGTGKLIKLQKRNEVFTINSGNFTLELSLPCPPGCH
ncbi:MAG: hypothetical protein KDC52_19140 [Ignavibacteriae bacterium]|nr:hypothetical protein [Ignavibacteriota bacterium]MCB9250758.1 hypothetical protein [Ignavibacteriales bacterium]